MSTTDAGRADTFLRTGFIAYFAGNRVAANLLMLLLVFTGVLSAIHLPVQNFPDLDFRAVSVSVRSPGSSPRELEEDIVRRVEEAVLGLSGVERVVSTATHGLGRVSVEMADFADAGTVLDDVVRAVDGIESFPPLGAERPEVELFRLDLEVMTMAVSSSVVGENELRLAAEELRDGLLGLPSISLVTLERTRDREISIELSEEELRRNDLTINLPRPGVESDNASHLASVRIHLNPRPVRTASPVEIESAWRRHAGDVSGLGEVEYRTSRLNFPPNVAYAIKHEDPEILAQAAAELRSLMETVPGVYGVADSLQPGKRHFQITLTPAGKAAGLTPALVGRQLRANFHGVSVQRLQRGHEELKVMVRYPAERRWSLRELTSERIHRPGGGEVPLSMAAEITEKRELATLTRIDGRQAARVHARADTAVVTPIQARRAIREQFIPGLLAKYPGIRIEADGGERRERAMLGTLSVLVPIALIAIFALMAAFLRSYWKPIIAVAGIPTAFAGAVLGHWVLGWDFTAMSMFGVIAVAGVVVNDALVRLDRYNTMRRENAMLPAIAAAAATRHRFRAVFLTSLTTVLGLSPMLYDRSDALINLVPLVVSMWGGLVLATLFVLFLLPALVMMVEGRRD